MLFPLPTKGLKNYGVQKIPFNAKQITIFLSLPKKNGLVTAFNARQLSVLNRAMQIVLVPRFPRLSI